MMFKKMKFFMFYTNEEKWLNKMAEKGFHLVKYSFPRYHFQVGEPGKYEYRLELLNESPQSEESQNYMEFMEEAGIDCVDTFQNWVYFRREKTDEPFEIYTDAESKIKHLNRIITFLAIVAFANLFIGIANIMNDTPYFWVLFIPLLNITGFLVLFLMILKYTKMKLDITRNT